MFGTSNPWGTPAFFERARAEDLRQIFHKYASTKIDDEWFMTSDDFVRKFLGLLTTENYSTESVKILAGMIDTSKDDLISFREFQTFEGLLCVPDAVYNTAFRLFDKNGNGLVSCDEFEEIMKQTTLHQLIPFDLDGAFVHLYFGEKKDRVVTYHEFSQFIHDFQDEYASQAFRRFDTNNSGFVSVDDFCTIMSTIRSHLITKHVKPVLQKLVRNVTGEEVSFPFFIAFNTILSNVELAKKVYLLASRGFRDHEISVHEFQAASNLMGQITPLQSQILFSLSNLIHDSPTMIYTDFDKIAPEQYYRKVQKRIVDIKAVQSPEERGPLIELLENLYRFTIGVAAGAAGAVATYPMDVIKTRMQLNRPSSLFEGRLYSGTRDCISKVWRHEGPLAFYRGIVPQVIGVSLGKAVKLTVNDYIRDKFMNRKGIVPFPQEIFAGACAGFLNVFLINPLEAIKINIQAARQLDHTTRLSASTALKNIGVRGLGRGFVSCCLREVPFAMIFFPYYAHLKVRFQDEDGYNGATSLLLAGVVASLPGAVISMPFDKIKTRLQAEPLPGQRRYTGMIDVARNIYYEEGVKGFYQGTRLIKPSSQFGVTLLVYEVLQRLFYIDFAGTRPTGSEKTVLVAGLEHVKSSNPDHIGGYALALPIISGIETKFGLVFPKFRHEVLHTDNLQPNTKLSS